MNSEPRLSTRRLNDMGLGFMHAGTLLAAIEIGLGGGVRRQGCARSSGGPRQLAAMMLDLQEQGCHNFNWVTPEHVVPQIRRCPE